ncbi:hypothetical protein EHP00_1617 [Ecytonucleospora hepatopenaei]|uniref:Uncharacterized protein n=1 Tax=Ecytonucleospora hepatopenaei TaxID=646526 RepID=A0A1W0E960_9MICR|nr:hypothetical protein EHP00_1617 [Ecytonucleospora hepatopenaei]
MANDLKNILIVAKNAHQFENYVIPGVNVDVIGRDVKYDLVIYTDIVFSLNLKHCKSISDAEIWFERKEEMTNTIISNAIDHYKKCEKRLGK